MIWSSVRRDKCPDIFFRRQGRTKISWSSIMNEPKDFCYWLQSFAELQPDAVLTPTQWQIVKDHLALVFNKVTPKRKEPTYCTQSPHDLLESLGKTFDNPNWNGTFPPLVPPKFIC